MYDRLYMQIQCVESLKRKSFILMKLHIFLHQTFYLYKIFYF